MTDYDVAPIQNKAARIAGLVYLLTLAVVVVANYSVAFRFIIPGNIAETTHNIVAHEQLFRLNAALDLVYAAGIMVLLAALYTVLNPVGRGLALLAAVFRFVYAFLWVVIGLCLMGILRLLPSSEVLPNQLPSVVTMFLGVSSNAYTAGLVFWGSASTACAFQLYRSRYVPRLLAIWGMISSAWCAICGLGAVTISDFAKIVNPDLYDVPMLVFEIAIAVIFLWRGLQPNPITKEKINRIEISRDKT